MLRELGEFRPQKVSYNTTLFNPNLSLDVPIHINEYRNRVSGRLSGLDFICSGLAIRTRPGVATDIYSATLGWLKNSNMLVGDMGFSMSLAYENLTHILALGLIGLDTYFRYMDQPMLDHATMRPDYLLGVTNEKMASFSIRHLGFSDYQITDLRMRGKRGIIIKTEKAKDALESLKSPGRNRNTSRYGRILWRFLKECETKAIEQDRPTEDVILRRLMRKDSMECLYNFEDMLPIPASILLAIKGISSDSSSANGYLYLLPSIVVGQFSLKFLIDKFVSMRRQKKLDNHLG